jgi:hypothetical protein
MGRSYNVPSVPGVKAKGVERERQAPNKSRNSGKASRECIRNRTSAPTSQIPPATTFIMRVKSCIAQLELFSPDKGGKKHVPKELEN